MLPASAFFPGGDSTQAPCAKIEPTERFCYVTVDMYSSPPTLLAITNTPADVEEAMYRDPNAVPLSADQLEVTKGWRDAIAAVRRNREGWQTVNKETLSVCFAHAFGKCHGRSRGDPSTCQQLHIKKEALTVVRSIYKSPQRRYFLRSFRTMVPPEIVHLVTMVARQIAALEGPAAAPPAPLAGILEFACRDVMPTVGATVVDAAFRHALNSNGDASPNKYSGTLCATYARTGSCPFNEECVYLHVRLHCTVTPHSHTMDVALRAFGGLPPDAAVPAVTVAAPCVGLAATGAKPTTTAFAVSPVSTMAQPPVLSQPQPAVPIWGPLDPSHGAATMVPTRRPLSQGKANVVAVPASAAVKQPTMAVFASHGHGGSGSILDTLDWVLSRERKAVVGAAAANSPQQPIG